MNSAKRTWFSDIELMSENRGPLAEDTVVTNPAEANPDPLARQRLEEIRSALVRSARGGQHRVPERDAEDVAHEAIVKYLRQPAAPGVPDQARAFRALRDSRADYYRRRNRRPEELAGDVFGSSSQAPDQRWVEAAFTIEQIAGRDARLFCQHKAEGYTQEDIGRLPGWTPRRAAAAYKQFQRHHQQIADALAIKLKETDGT